MTTGVSQQVQLTLLRGNIYTNHIYVIYCVMSYRERFASKIKPVARGIGHVARLIEGLQFWVLPP
jgi:hypothetical protein